MGYLEGKNIVIEQRYGKHHQQPALVAELVRLKVDIIVTGPGGVRAAKKASSTIPIIMTYSADPVRAGLVASLAHPGGSVTGLSDYHGDLGAKRLELLKEVVPLASRVAVLFNPAAPSNRPLLKASRLPPQHWACQFSPWKSKDLTMSTVRFPRLERNALGAFSKVLGSAVIEAGS